MYLLTKFMPHRYVAVLAANAEKNYKKNVI